MAIIRIRNVFSCIINGSSSIYNNFLLFINIQTIRKNYDAAVMTVGHIGFGLGAVPVAMTTMQTVCKNIDILS